MSAADTRQRILAIAADLFARQGYTGTTIADIARELGTTTAALYYHFPSKADILGGLLAEPLIAYTRIIESLDANQPEPAELLGAFIDLAVDSRALAGLIDRDPAVLAMIDERLPRTSRQTTGQVIAVLAGPDPDRSAVVRAHAALAVIKGATMAALELGGGALEPAEREEILQLALGALSGPQPDQASVGLPPLLPRFALTKPWAAVTAICTVAASRLPGDGCHGHGLCTACRPMPTLKMLLTIRCSSSSGTKPTHDTDRVPFQTDPSGRSHDGI
jgi:AcrR family transcriptional regulator